MKYSVILVAQVTNTNIFEPEKKLVRAIKSFLNQTHKDKELIIIGNGCNKTQLIIEKYFSKFNEIKYFHNIKQIPLFFGAIQNKGIELSTGEYIMYLHQNDVLGSKHLEMINKEIIKSDNELFYYDTYSTLSDNFKNLKKNYIELRANSVNIKSIVHKKSQIDWGDGIGNDWVLLMKMIYNGVSYQKLEVGQYISGEIKYDDLKSLKPKLDNSNKNVAVLLHLFYIELWDEFKVKIDKMDTKHHIFVNLVKDSYDENTLNEFKEKIEKLDNVTVLISDNIGLDIGGTLFLLQYILDNDLEFDYMLKIHSKKSIHSGRDKKRANEWQRSGQEWRDQLTSPIMGDGDIINNVLSLFGSSKEIGIIGSNLNILSSKHMYAMRNINYIHDYTKRFNIKYPIQELRFVAGTMFWARFDLFKKYFTMIKPIEIIAELEEGAFTDADGEKRTHALERVFGLMALGNNMHIVGV
jgi:hypothetical protein